MRLCKGAYTKLTKTKRVYACCAVGALPNHAFSCLAIEALSRAAGQEITSYNDRAQTRKTHILAVYDEAIAAEKAKTNADL